MIHHYLVHGLVLIREQVIAWTNDDQQSEADDSKFQWRSHHYHIEAKTIPGCHFADKIPCYIFMNENFYISI